MGYLTRIGILILFFVSSAVLAEGAGPGFVQIVPPQPTQETDKIEVIEFFWYGCPHCSSFEPHLSEWLKTVPDNVQFIRQPTIFSAEWAPGARAYFVADALDITDKVHSDLFSAIQEQHRPLDTEAQMADFFVEHGVEKNAFHEAYNSFIVATRMRQAENMPIRYGVTGVPAIIVNGKYRTNATLAKTFSNLLAVMNGLIAKESGGSK